MANNGSIYHELNGQYVLVNTRTSTMIGLMQQDTHESIHLMPSIVHEPRLSLREGKMESNPHYRFETGLPTIIATMEVQSIQPTTEEHIRQIINYDKQRKYDPHFEQGDKK